MGSLFSNDVVRMWKEALLSWHLRGGGTEDDHEILQSKIGTERAQLTSLSLVPPLRAQKYKSAAQCCRKCAQSARILHLVQHCETAYVATWSVFVKGVSWGVRSFPVLTYVRITREHGI